MIRLMLVDGRTLDLAESTLLAVDGEEFSAGDVQQILMIEPMVSVLDGRVTGTADQRRGLRFVDAPTGIAITVPMMAQEAKMLGAELGKEKVEVFRGMPPSPPS